MDRVDCAATYPEKQALVKSGAVVLSFVGEKNRYDRRGPALGSPLQRWQVMHIGVYCACIRVYMKVTREQRRYPFPELRPLRFFPLSVRSRVSIWVLAYSRNRPSITEGGEFSGSRPKVKAGG